eukprot:g19352.t1
MSTANGESEVTEPLEEPRALRDERRFLHQRFDAWFRAAAFHCGLLWALAAQDVLKDVSHLASVSGGAYTAACYATHLLKLAEEAPPPGAAGSGGLDRWYKEVAAKTILRMQQLF